MYTETNTSEWSDKVSLHSTLSSPACASWRPRPSRIQSAALCLHYTSWRSFALHPLPSPTRSEPLRPQHSRWRSSAYSGPEARKRDQGCYSSPSCRTLPLFLSKCPLGHVQQRRIDGGWPLVSKEYTGEERRRRSARLAPRDQSQKFAVYLFPNYQSSQIALQWWSHSAG